MSPRATPVTVAVIGTGTVGQWLTIAGPGAGPALAGLGVFSDVIALARRHAERVAG